jgi:hypothetical protein
VLLRSILVLLAVAVSVLPLAAADLAAIKREIAKEPKYQATPRYCLLVFGTEAATRVWVVMDGNNALFVDRNGNGDLTEPGEKLTNTSGSFFRIDRIVERDGTVHTNLQLWCEPNNQCAMEIGVGQRQQYVGIGNMDRPTWGDKPATAPIIHFNGPMTFERYGPTHRIPRGAGNSQSRKYALRVMLGTPGLGAGTFASYDEVCSENLGPIQADIEYASVVADGPPIKQRIDLIHDG